MVNGEFDRNLPPKILLALLNEYLNKTQDISKVIIVLDKLIKHFSTDDERIEMEIHFLSDGFYLAEQNISGNLTEVLNNLRGFLNQFVDYKKYLT
jgi:hypothetical protein